MSTTQTGRAAEEAAAKYLLDKGYKLIDQNWRTRWCEIDLIVSQENVIYFVEVKYRSNNKWGSGIDYITSKKLQQMHFAAEFWIARHKTHADYHLAMIEVEGPELTITNWLKDL